MLSPQAAMSLPQKIFNWKSNISCAYHGGIIEKERARTPLQKYNHRFRYLHNKPDNNTEPNPLPVLTRC
jgi:hypothetical protein